MNDKRIVELALRGIDQEIEALRRERAALQPAFRANIQTAAISTAPNAKWPTKFKKAAAIKTRRKAAGRG